MPKSRFAQILIAGVILEILWMVKIFVFESSYNAYSSGSDLILIQHPSTIKSMNATKNATNELQSDMILMHPPTTKSSMNATKSATMVNELQPEETKRETKPYVVCTYLRGNDNKYIVGTIALMESVRNYTLGETFNSTTTTPEIRTAVVCHESVQNSTRSVLEKLGHDVIVVQDVDFDDSLMPSDHFHILLQKYAVFDLTQYQRALFVDSDAFVLKPQELRGIFGLLDDEEERRSPSKTSISAKLADINWSRFKKQNVSSIYESNTTIGSTMPATNTKIMMSLDFGSDDFNSGVILYEPSITIFKEFRAFLDQSVMSMRKFLRNRRIPSTQRALQEFLFSPSNHFQLYSLCGDTHPHQCNREGCYCHTHVYPQLHDCKKDQSFLQDSAIIVHFAGGAIDYDTLCDPNTSPTHLEQTIQDYFAKARKNQESNANFDFECQRPILQRLRDYYSKALHRIDRM